MFAWEWTLEKARDGETDKVEVKTTRKISQTAQVRMDGSGLKIKSIFNETILYVYSLSPTGNL